MNKNFLILRLFQGRTFSVAMWLLDVVVSDAEFTSELSKLKEPVWFVIMADGLSQHFSTPSTKCRSNPRWNYPFRLVLPINDIICSYLYISLCTYAKNREIISLARCRVSLGSMPSGNAKTVRFPLISGDKQVAVLRCCSTISEYQPQNAATQTLY